MGHHCTVNSVKYIGRVGALAVALGIGAAVSSGAGIARAEGPAGTGAGANSGEAQHGADTSSGDSTEGASHPLKPSKPRMVRAPRMQQNNSGGAHRSTLRRGAQSDDDTAQDAAAADQSRASAADDDGEMADAVDALMPAEDAGPTDPLSDTRGNSSRHDAVGASGAGAPGRLHRMEIVATTRAREPIQDTAPAPRQPSSALDDKPSADSTALVGTDYSTWGHHIVESEGASSGLTPRLTAVPPVKPIGTVVSSLLAAVGIAAPPSGVSTGDVPAAPMPLLLGALQLIRREIELTSLGAASSVAPNAVAPRSLVASAATGTTTPQPGDATSTAYGDIGKWMLQSNGQISNWGGQTHDGKALLEPVNVIIIDPTSTSREESIKKLNRAMTAAGFPAEAPHSTGYQGVIDGVTYGQQPSGFLQAFTDNSSDHGRIFGPAPAADGQGYVWTGAFSTEGGTHQYVSFDTARDELASRLVTSGAATRLDDVDMGNTGITGDFDGKAVVLLLNAMPNTAPSATATQGKPSTSTGKVTGKVTATDPDGDQLTYTGITTDKGSVTVSSTGAFAYTPTAAARHAAAASNATADDKTGTFTITVSDGFGGVTSVPFTVALVPKNSAPSAKAAVGKADPVHGTVTGSIAVTDADSDVVTFSASDAASGSVIMKPNGTFTYEPSDAARQQARVKKAIGTDKFTVTVDDGHGGVKTVTVKTTIAPTDQAPVAGTPEVGAPAASNGAIKGSVSASDPDRDSYSFSVWTKPAKGTVSVSSEGTFTYTPTAAARRAAASDPATATDTFIIAVTDKYGATDFVDVPVSILGK